MAAEWAILLIVVPAIVIPVVLLFGLAGCDLVFPVNFNPAPVIQSADGTSASTIRLVWSYNNSGQTEFLVEATKLGDIPLPLLHTTSLGLDVVDLEEGTTYSFRVQAVRSGDDSPFSAPVEGTTFGTSFNQVFVPGGASDVPIQGAAFVMKIEPARLNRSGGRVALTLLGPSAGTTSIDRMYLSQPDPGGDDPYDAAGDLTRVFNVNAGDTAVVVQANEIRLLTPVIYNLDRAVPLLVAFDVTSITPSTILSQPVAVQDGVTFVRSGAEAALAPRSTGSAQQGLFYLVTRIDVA